METPNKATIRSHAKVGPQILLFSPFAKIQNWGRLIRRTLAHYSRFFVFAACLVAVLSFRLCSARDSTFQVLRNLFMQTSDLAKIELLWNQIGKYSLVLVRLQKNGLLKYCLESHKLDWQKQETNKLYEKKPAQLQFRMT